ncbi:hypothetical protein WN51_06127 [Melipona quadrifasciata]|uniref:Uncharacterized protein n=1 Tax=Melipona quadrifasciata TaxID=166423 RepID=A0A0M8ZRM2_9HYME|nr:hypothetical protein WN51_06127 [Melipona quadrifasciata]
MFVTGTKGQLDFSSSSSEQSRYAQGASSSLMNTLNQSQQLSNYKRKKRFFLTRKPSSRLESS